YALVEVETAMAAKPSRLSGYLAIRGSILRALGRTREASKDHEEMVRLRKTESPSDAATGEALAELGWTYAWGLRLWKARKNLSEGVALMRKTTVQSPAAAGFRTRALRKFAIVQLVTFDFHGARKSIAEARQLARDYLVRDQQRSILRL